MFTRVIIFATAILAVTTQDHYSHGHATSSQSVIRNDVSHNNHGRGIQVHRSPLSYYTSPSVIHSAPVPYHRRAIHDVPLTHTAAITHATPHLTHAVTHIPPIAHHTPILSGAGTHNAASYQTHYAPIVQTSPLTHYSAPIHSHQAPIAHQISPIFHQATPHYAVPAVSLQHAPAYNNQHHYASGYQHYDEHPRYEFNYSVNDLHTGDIKSQHESRDGDVVNGVYSLHEADGSIRTVHYNTHGHSGFNAEVHHAQPSSHVQAAPHYYHH